VLSGIVPIDEAIGPIRAKDLVIVAGRPGMGKSVVGLNYTPERPLRPARRRPSSASR
jgi:replicative DNA helicase